MTLFQRLLFLTLLVSSMADKQLFVGKWKLIEAYDEQMQLFDLPEGDFFWELEDTDDGDSLSAFIKVGNSMRTTINFLSTTTAGEDISMGLLMSTMMMPPEPLFRLETYLSDVMPKMTLLQQQETTIGNNTTKTITFSGVGKLVCQEAS